MLSTGIRTPVGVKVIGTDLVEIDRLARQIEQVLRDGARHLLGLCRARHRRLLSRDRAGPRGAGALRHHGPGRAGHDCNGARRTDRDDDGGRTPALHGQHALSARPAGQSGEDRKRHPRPHAGRRRSAARGGGDGSTDARPDDDPDRERPACDLHLRRHPRPRSRRLCRRCAARGAGEHPVPARLLRVLERPVRISRAGDGAAEDRGAGDAADHLPAALPQFPLGHGDCHRDALAAVRAGRRILADVVARLQPVGGGCGRFHRAGRRRRRDRRGDADVSQPGSGWDRKAPRCRRTSAQPRRPPRSHHGGRGRAGAARR